MPSFSFIRTIRTASSERFLLAVNGTESAAALDLHYLPNGGVAATLCILDQAIGDDQITAVIEQIDEVLLPEVSRAEGNLHFTVVRGQAVGDFVPHVPADGGMR
ncbi:MAG TPA: hypothetical protein VF278_03965 [Pirellulales bacterium]